MPVYHSDCKYLRKGVCQQTNYIEFQVNNGKPVIDRKIHKAKTGGIGLENVRKRLELIYKDAYDLVISDNLKDFNVQLKIETA